MLEKVTDYEAYRLVLGGLFGFGLEESQVADQLALEVFQVCRQGFGCGRGREGTANLGH